MSATLRKIFLGLNLLPIIESASHLLLLDAANAGQARSLVKLAKEQIPLYAGVKMSQHQITFQKVLGVANIRGRLASVINDSVQFY